MSKYCKAYKLSELRKYPEWSNSSSEKEKELDDEAIVYLTESFKVTSNCLELDKTEDYLFTAVNEAWESFCKDVLAFVVPDWEAESAKIREALQGTSS